MVSPSSHAMSPASVLTQHRACAAHTALPHTVLPPAGLYVYNKIDVCSMEEVDEIARRPYSIPISCYQKLNFDGLLARIWSMMVRQQGVWETGRDGGREEGGGRAGREAGLLCGFSHIWPPAGAHLVHDGEAD